MRHRLRLLSFTLFLLGGPMAGHGEPSLQLLSERPLLSELPEPIRFERFGPEHGLPHNTVSDIEEDSDGFLWFATDDGLVRFDGHIFRIFRPRPELRVASRVHLCEERLDGRLLVVGETVMHFDRRTERFELAFDRSAGEGWGSFGAMEDPRGVLWLLSEHRLARLGPGALESGAHESGERGPGKPGHEGIVPLEVPRPDGWTSESWGRFARGPDGEVWIRLATRMGSGVRFQIYRLTESGPEPVGAATVASDVYRPDFHVDKEGRFWLGQAVEGSSSSGFEVVTTSVIPTDNSLTAFAESEDGVVWLGSSDGLFRLEPGRPAQPLAIDDERGWQHNWARDLYLDGDHRLWVATMGGVYRAELDGSPFRHLGAGRIADGPIPVSGLEENAHGLWVGTFGQGLRLLDERGEPVEVWREDAWPCGDVIWDLETAADGVLWIAYEGGICRFDGEGFEAFPEPASSIRSLALPGDGLWVAVAGWGIRRHSADFSRLSADLGGANPTSPGALVSMSDGTLWLGLSDGMLLEVDRGSERVTQHALVDGSSGGKSAPRRVIEIYDLSPGEGAQLWLATSSGLASYDRETGEFSFVDDLAKFPGTVTFSLIRDGAQLWLGTNHGLVGYEIGAEAGSRIRAFGLEDGVGNIEFNRYSRFKRANGEILMGGMSGLTAFHPSRVLEPEAAYPIVLSDLRIIDDEGLRRPPVHGLDRLRLGPRDLSVSFEFTELSFRARRGDRYEYRLEGAEDRWLAAGEGRLARYTHLPPGGYRFEVRLAREPEGPRLSLPVEVSPPFWATWWFRLLTAALSLGLITWAYRARVRHLIELERLRLRIAADLHDELGSELSGIALSSAMVARSEGLDKRDRQRLSEVETSSLRVMDGLRDIVWSVHPDHDRLESLVDRLRSAAYRLAGDLEVEFRATGGGDLEGFLDMTSRRQLLLAYKELVTNACRHAEATHLRIVVSQTDLAGARLPKKVRSQSRLSHGPVSHGPISHGSKALEVRVEDNGRGLAANERRDGTGLGNVGRRIEELGGELEIRSEPGEGTRARLVLPLTLMRHGRGRGRSLK